eukprot:CAMPEP_0184871308 /NCGR_PEP_ID=MMETSP0580-20130426/40644_1 /TAXON_ID=1118495 /ORGANISM="Dactyliosolen fragilissimus" /LENGTH=808 /DNA_ID=CAMNT_0027373951 /DNA_START=429 /DNA_END=2855 /DNA_ORIENTATION=-
MLASSSKIYAKIPQSNNAVGSNSPHLDQKHKNRLSTLNVDFVIVGHGSAGKKALETLNRLCPDASIAVIERNNSISRSIEKMQRDCTDTYKRLESKKLHFIEGTAVELDHLNHHILCEEGKYESPRNSESNHITHNKSGTSIHFRHSLLIATGSRGAPPPMAQIDPDASERVLELKSTRSNPSAHTILNPQLIREITLMAASQNANICILGSGLEALELSLLAAANINLLNAKSTKKRKVLRKNEKHKPEGGIKYASSEGKKIAGYIDKRDNNKNSILLVFGNSGPLNNILPRYLSVAVTQRLRQLGISVEDRSLVQYVASNLGAKNSINIHMMKSYDSLDTKCAASDLMIVAPSVDGQRGTAVVPITNNHPSTITLDNQITSSYKPWSKLLKSRQSGIACFVDDSRIIVNSEMNAVSKIYAAGSVAKFPNALTGHACVAHGAGEYAALNMAKLYYEQNGNKKKMDTDTFLEKYYDLCIPVWHSERLESSMGSKFKYLRAAGIETVCVGNCDSETMATHGFFWTNQSALNRKKTERKISSNKVNDFGNQFKKVVYGHGVVFYFDRSGSLRGIMLWGFPSTKPCIKSNIEELNMNLLNRMKEVVCSDGEVMKRDHSVTLEKNNMNNHILCSAHLLEESRLLASIATEGIDELDQKNSFHVIKSLKPLHRYVPCKPLNVTRMGTLKIQSEIGNGSVGEDIFIRENTNLSGEKLPRPSSLIHVYPMESDTSISQFKQGMVNTTTSHLVSRPPKEEPLWARRSEWNKHVAMDKVLSEIFLFNLRQGKFYDGSDSVSQAPMPKMFTNSKNDKA